MKFHNTLTGKLEEFKPLDPQNKKVKFYACGPTVYDYAHIGNFRTFVFEDLLRRVLEFKGYEVNHVMNITDVDDKTIAGANKEGKSLSEYTKKYTEAFQEDLKVLNCLLPTKQPKATDEIKSMLELIQKLVSKGTAYESDGSVYFSVSKFSDYGKLSKKKLDQNIAGASERVDVDEYDKEQVSDFVLWKKSKDGEPGWDSPWGKGRPGWHIECSAMSMKELGPVIDIHAGGEDLIFPHHENEIAQSEAVTGLQFVKYWLHSKHLLVNGEKMSKSKGNFYTLRDLLAKGYDPMAIRYALLSTHYRSQLNFTLEGLKEAGEIIKRLDECYWQCLSQYSSAKSKPVQKKIEMETIDKSLSDDLNVANSFAALLGVISEINSRLSQMGREEMDETLKFFTLIDQIFGFDIASVKEIPNNVQQKLPLLQKYRNERNFAEADKIRTELKNEGWLVKDGRPGEPSTVKKKRRVWDK